MGGQGRGCRLGNGIQQNFADFLWLFEKCFMEMNRHTAINLSIGTDSPD